MKLFTLLSRRSTRELLQGLLKDVHVGDSIWDFTADMFM